ncbi:uncharacterized protein BX664DRAFT_99026 [Halteromyces radiatus]|uniref:uncharacterized protein n=1 Tax=Halteromyces radiatus TaxID=101107 RepID=UPI0022204F11|nr:uncharacterized protein BX664DRAFT_99026 [Halteromyces radiatus]KAI8093013.1 hypothetical protein BX664DRAFT_99026 [Halteromyces radiatus]
MTSTTSMEIDGHEKCTCSDLNHHHHHHPLSQNDSNGLVSQQHPSLLNNNNNNSTTSGLVPTFVPSSSSPASTMVDNSFSWAVVTPHQESLFTNPTDDPINLGFIFHKSSSQRFLEGQPRPPRKKSMKRHSIQRAPSPHAGNGIQSSGLTNTTNNGIVSMIPSSSSCTQQQQQDFMLPVDLDLPSSSSSCSDTNGSLTTELSMILNNVLKPMQQFSEEDEMNQELADLELTQNSTKLMYPPSCSSTTSSSPGTPPHPFPKQQQQQQQYPSQQHELTSTSSSPTSSFYLPNNMMSTANDLGLGQSFDQVGCCGGHFSQSSEQQGESVVITIAPLSATTNNALQGSEQVRTRIVTCYCGNQCTCPGCLVHPGNFLVGDPMMDPYRGLSSTCPSSTASSIYSASDDEEQQQPAILL